VGIGIPMGMGVGIEIPSPRQPWPGVRNEGQKPETQGPTAEVVFLGSAVSSPSGVQGGVPVVKGFFLYSRGARLPLLELGQGQVRGHNLIAPPSL